MATMIDLLRAAFFTPLRHDNWWGVPLLFIGAPGIGKSATLESFAQDYKLPLEILSPALRGEGAFGVIPVPLTNAAGVTQLSYPAPDWALALDGQGLVVLDEITCAPPALQAPLLGLVLDRRVGAYQLPGRVRVVAAANPAEQAAGGWEISPPLANRFCWISWAALDANDWADGLGSGWTNTSNTGQDVTAEETRVLAAWPIAWAQATGTIGAFVRRRSELLSACPAIGSPDAAGAWPSPRSWEMAARLWASAAVQGLTESDRDLLVAGCIGAPATVELAAFAATLDLPDPAALLGGSVAWKHDPYRLDRSVAVLDSAVTWLVAEHAKAPRPTEADRLWAILAAVIKDAPDLAYRPAMRAVKARIPVTKAAQAPLAALAPVMAAAGLHA